MKITQTLLFFIFAIASFNTLSHGGGTDAKGCHTEKANGSYHCHSAPKAAVQDTLNEKATTDDEIVKLIIAESIANYPGNCPCPYNRASNGSRCGKRSAYSKPGGREPICYASDVTGAMIEAYKAKN